MILLMPFVLYAPAIPGSRVWDDFFLIGQNPFYKSPALLLEAFHHWLFLDPAAAYYRPIQNWSYFLDYLLWHQWLPGYHLHSILLHSLVGVVLWRLLRGLLTDENLAGMRWDCAAFGTAFVWVIHPAHNAAVAYISGRADSLAALLALSAWMAYRASIAPYRIAGLLLAAVLALGAMCSRESGLLWLALFVLYECVFRKNVPRARRAGAFMASAVLLGIYAILRSLPPDAGPKASSESISSPINGLAHAMLALGDYVALLVAPFRLTMERDLAVQNPMPYLLSATVFIIVCALLWQYPGSTRRLRRLATAWFFLAAIPILPFTPRTAVSAEHWMYIPFMGIIFSALCLAAQLPVPVWRDEPDYKARLQGVPWLFVAITSLLVWSSLLATRTVLRARDWQSHQHFINATHAHGRSTDRFRGVMAGELFQQNEFAKAEKLMRESIDRNPTNRLLRVPLGKLLASQGKYEQALAYLDFSIEELKVLRHQHPLYAEAAIHRADVLWKTSRREEAIRYLQKAVELWPLSWNVHAALGTKLQSIGDVIGTTELVKSYLRRARWDLKAWESLARLLALQGQTEQAIVAWEEAARLDIHRVEALVGLAIAYHQLGQRQELVDTLERAMHRDPDHPALVAFIKSL